MWDIRTLYRCFRTAYENVDALGLRRITIMYNVFEYGAGSESLEGHTGVGGFLAIAGIGGSNDGLAQEPGAKVGIIKGKKNYQFIHKYKFAKKEKVTILSELYSDIHQDEQGLNIYLMKNTCNFSGIINVMFVMEINELYYGRNKNCQH